MINLEPWYNLLNFIVIKNPIRESYPLEYYLGGLWFKFPDCFDFWKELIMNFCSLFNNDPEF